MPNYHINKHWQYYIFQPKTLNIYNLTNYHVQCTCNYIFYFSSLVIKKILYLTTVAILNRISGRQIQKLVVFALREYDQLSTTKNKLCHDTSEIISKIAEKATKI